MSLIKTEKTEKNNIYELTFLIEPEAFNKKLDSIFASKSKRIEIPGFRRGKAPRHIIEKMYGEKLFFDDAVNELFPEYAEAAIEECELDVVTKPINVELIDVTKQDGAQLKIEVAIKPEANISDYKGLHVKKPATVLAESVIEDEVNKLREQNSRLVSVEDRSAKEGDTVVFDFKGMLNGVAFDGGTAENYQLELGSHQFIPGFEEQLVGHASDEQFDISVTFPEDYGSKELAGKEAVFEIKLKDIMYKEYPEIDDEFAKDVSEFDTLEELKDDIRKGKLDELEKKHDNAIENEITELLNEKLEADIPEPMIEERIDDEIDSFAQRLSSSGLSLDAYMNYTKATPESMRESFREPAIKIIKTRLALEKIAQLEGITVSEDEYTEELKKLAESYSVDVEKLQNAVSRKHLEEDILVKKGMKFVKDNAVIEEIAHESHDDCCDCEHEHETQDVEAE